MAALLFVAFLVLLGVAVMLGYTVDSRDPEYSLGKVLTAVRPKDADGR
jgi:hypothetical protein